MKFSEEKLFRHYKIMFSNSELNRNYVVLNFEFTIGCSTGLLALLVCFPKIAPRFKKHRLIRLILVTYPSAFGASDVQCLILFTKIGIYIHPIGHLRSSTLLWMNDCEPWFMYGDCGELAQGDTTENFQVGQLESQTVQMMNDKWRMKMNVSLLLQTHSFISVILHWIFF